MQSVVSRPQVIPQVAAQGDIATPETLTRICGEIQPGQDQPDQGPARLLQAIRRSMPDYRINHVLTRGGWHRLGGLVDASHRRIAGNILQWLEQTCDGDLDATLETYQDAGYLITRLAGRTHFFTAARSEAPQDFIQIEIEELQERTERALVEPDLLPDNLEEFLDPLDYTPVEPTEIGVPLYQFRRITRIAELLAAAEAGRQSENLRRFLSDWNNSSAAEHRFCDHWVLALREYRDQDGQHRYTARPVSVHEQRQPAWPDIPLRGVELANALHMYDRHLGYPFAWYFMMLANSAANYSLAQAVLADQHESYNYLAARDLRVLLEWEKRPYGV